MDTQGVGYSLGTFADPPGMNLLVEINEKEFDAIETALAAGRRLDVPFHLTLVERNLLDLESIHQFATILLSLGRSFGPVDPRLLSEAVCTSVVNWLTSVRLFVDHEETDVKRRHGHASPEAAAFKSATAAVYDSHVGYRFAYKFRNYVQHCGLPMMSISIVENRDGGPLRQRASLQLDRDDLLANYSEWGPVRTDLREMDAKFGLLELVEDAMAGVREIYRTVLDTRLDEALRHVPVLEEALERIHAVAAAESGAPATYTYRGDFCGSTEVSPRLLPEAAVRRLSEVRNGRATRESLFQEPQERPRPKFDPATVRDRFHRESRAVQILSAWLAEGGRTPGFIRIVNGIVRDDRSIEPLLTGLVDVTVLFAHMTAGALGATAHGLVASLLDVYGETE